MSRPLRVLHVTQPVDAGVAQVVLDLARRQGGAGVEVVVAAPAALAERVVTTGARHVRWEATRSPGASTPGETVRLMRIVHGEEPDVVHLHSAKAGLAGRLAVRGRRATVFMPHAWSWHVGGATTANLARRWERLGARWVDALVCVSEDERREGETAGVRAPYVVVPNRVDRAELAELAPTSRIAARELLGIDPGAPLVVCVGRLAEQKGQDVLLEAWPSVVEAHPGAQLVLVGDGPERESLDLRARTTTSVRLVGACDRRDALAWMRAADVVAVPSRYEGMALVPLEADALGAHVVASRVAGMVDALGPRGSGSRHRTVPPGDVVALARALRGALADGATECALPRPDLAPAPVGRDDRLLDLYHRLAEARQGDSHP